MCNERRKLKRFGTQGPVHPDRNYIVSRTQEINDYIGRVQEGRYIVVFAPRQTGKTTFFRWSLDKITSKDNSYLNDLC